MMPDSVVAQQKFPVGSLRHSLYYRQDPDQQPSRCALCVVALDTLRAPLWSQACIQCTAWSTPRQALDLQEILTLSSSESHTQPISAYAVQPGYLRFTSCAGVSNAGSRGCKDLSTSSETIQGQRSVPHGRTPGRGARAGRENSHCDILLQLFKL